MRYYKLYCYDWDVYFSVACKEKPYLFYNTAREKEWIWGRVNSWENHDSHSQAQEVSKLEVLVVCGSVPDDNDYKEKHFPKYEERYDDCE